jgi:hypothetical protein
VHGVASSTAKLPSNGGTLSKGVRMVSWDDATQDLVTALKPTINDPPAIVPTKPRRERLMAMARGEVRANPGEGDRSVFSSNWPSWLGGAP